MRSITHTNITASVRACTGALSAMLASLLVAAPCWAALGGGAASVSADGAALNGQVRTTSTVQYDVHEITNDGMTVHEYVTRQGQVFAISWQGPFKPDLRQLLGDYFSRYQSAAGAVPRAGSHRLFAVNTPDLVIESTGHLRAFQGLAYIPSLVPSGVSVSQLQ